MWRQPQLPPRSLLLQPKQGGRGAAGVSPCIDSYFLSLPVRDPPHSPKGPLPSLYSLTCVGRGRGWEGQQALKGKLLKPLGQEVAERGCFLWQSRGAVKAGPTSCLLAVGPRRLVRAESPSFPASTPIQKMEASGPPDQMGSSLGEGHLHFAGREILREGQTGQQKGRVGRAG